MLRVGPHQLRCPELIPSVRSFGSPQVGYLGGPLARLAQVIGVPVIRLRLAIPEEMIAGSVANGIFFPLFPFAMYPISIT